MSSVTEQLFGNNLDWLSHTTSATTRVTEEKIVVMADGTGIQLQDAGLLYLIPPADRPNPNAESLIVSAGIHGNETAPIEVLNGLVNELIEGQWQLACPVLLILGNPLAIDLGERFMEVNLNRLFSGAHGKPDYANLREADRARKLEDACRAFAARHPAGLSHYDLHTAIRPSLREKFALYPFVEGRKLPKVQTDFLLEAGVETLLLQHREATTFAAFSSAELGAESFTIELGKVQPFGQNDLNKFSGIRDALRRRFKGETPPEQSGAASPTLFEVVHEIINTGEDFRFHIPDDVANFTEYDTGAPIWEDAATRYTVGDAPEAIIFPNPRVPVGQRVGLMVRPVR
ncbi:succinylglutamate desuccinylase [Marinobacter confluentis]|uniref:Succinylglutamate desuccinylase n=1 Tax=Marinobacter confluentis TaxID=1697557 RepID=A0A4Z1BDW2_9GAMM|nr:succinylglutamate desuccinylase [Marinobacter confluentis]TGN40504.1 succinylglutamate desuccinylase [Marinobacter confluentis]